MVSGLTEGEEVDNIASEKERYMEIKVYTRKVFKGQKKVVALAEETTTMDGDGGSNKKDNASAITSTTTNMSKPLLCGVDSEDTTSTQTKISLVSETKVEMRERRRSIEGRLEMVRNWLKRIEAKQVELNGNSLTNPSLKQRVGNGGGKKHFNDDAVPSLHHFRVSMMENHPAMSSIREKKKRTPKANQFYCNSEFLLAKDKFPPPETNKKSKLKRNPSFRIGSKLFKNCNSLLEQLMNHKYGWVFDAPVDVQGLGLHDYFKVIKHPMDLGTVKSRLNGNMYKTHEQFAEDVRRTFYNAMAYNPKGQDVHIMAEQLLKTFEHKWIRVDKDDIHEMRVGLPTPTSTTRLRTIVSGKTPDPKKPKANDPVKRKMIYEEKQKLSTDLQNLPEDKLDVVVEIIRKRNSELFQDAEEIEVDIDVVDSETLWELFRFVSNYKKNLGRKKRKSEQIRVRLEAEHHFPKRQRTWLWQRFPKNLEQFYCSLSPLHLKADGMTVFPVQGERIDDNKSRSSSSSSSSSGYSSDSDEESSSTSTSHAESPRTGISVQATSH